MQMGWTGPLFKTDTYTDHHERMHRSVWARYQASSALNKSHFFDGNTSFTDTLLAHIETSLIALVLKYMIRAPIVNVIIGAGLHEGRNLLRRLRTSTDNFAQLINLNGPSNL